MTDHTIADTPLNQRRLPILHTPTQLGQLERKNHRQRSSTAQKRFPFAIFHLLLSCIFCLLHTRSAANHQDQHTNTNESVPLASPVESSEIRSTYSARPSNIFHIFSRPTPEQETTSSPRGRFEIRSTSRAPARLPSCCISHITF